MWFALAALHPAQARSAVATKHAIIAYCDEDDMAGLIGNGGINVQLASALVGRRIRVRPLDEAQATNWYEHLRHDERARAMVNLVLAFRLADRKITLPILVPVQPDNPLAYDIRMVETGDIGFFLPDPHLLTDDVRDVIVPMDGVPWCVPYSQTLGDLSSEERQRIEFVRLDAETRRERLDEALEYIRYGGWRPVAWDVGTEAEADAPFARGVKLGHGVGVVPPAPAIEVFPWGEPNDDPFA